MKRILFINPPVVCVNECQQGWYSYAHPTSILKLIAWHRLQGNEAAFIDCMGYGNESEPKPALKPYKKLPVGSGLNLYIDTHILGKSMSWLEDELKNQAPPDEIWISCHMTFNNELAHETIRTAKRIFPESDVLLGGNYATLFSEEARKKSGASVFKGLFPGAERLFPDYSLFREPLDYMVFQLALGCGNHCGHCLNSVLHKEIIQMDIRSLVEDLKLKKEIYGVSRFVNIDPNVACFDLKAFLRICIDLGLDAELYFYGGIQPDKVTPELASMMKETGVKGLTLPRELETDANVQLGKSYSQQHFYNAIDIFQKACFDLSDFHCSFPVGFADDNLLDIAAIIREITDMGAIPEIAPVAFVPGTPEYRRHAPLLEGKSLEELNWALWPALDSTAQIIAHATLYNAAHGNRFDKPWNLKSAVRGPL